MEDNNGKKQNAFDAASGISGAVGASMGFVAGTFIDSELKAETSTVEPNKPEVQVQTPVQEQVQQPTQTSTQAQEPTAEPVQTAESCDVEIVSYETISDEYGDEMDVAHVTIDGTDVLLADVDMDGIADVILADINNDNIIDDTEIAEVEDYNISMDVFENTVDNNSDMLAYNDDYVNDADVTDFMA